MIEVYFEVSCKKNLNLYLGCVMQDKSLIKQFHCLMKDFDQNILEVKAFNHAFEIVKKFCKKDEVTVFCSSNIERCIKEKWVEKWEKNGWKNSSHKEVKNKEDWKQLHIFYLEYIPDFKNSNQYQRKLFVTKLRRDVKSFIRKLTK